MSWWLGSNSPVSTFTSRCIVIELIDSSCQHLSSSSEQFYGDGRQASQFCIAFKCTEIMHFFNPLHAITSQTNWTTCGKSELWKIAFESASEHDARSQAVFYYVRKWMLNNCSRICHFMPFNEHFCPRRLSELQVNIFLAHLPAMWHERQEINLAVRCLSRLCLWKVVGLFLTSTKDKQTDGPLSMGTG